MSQHICVCPKSLGYQLSIIIIYSKRWFVSEHLFMRYGRKEYSSFHAIEKKTNFDSIYNTQNKIITFISFV